MNKQASIVVDQGLVLPSLRDYIRNHVEKSTAMAASLWKDMAQKIAQGSVARGRFGLEEQGRNFGFAATKLIGR